MFKRILVAIDGSDCSRLSLPAAVEMAKRFEGELFVLHVSEHDRGRAAVYSLETPADATRLVGDAVKTARDAGVSAAGDVHDRAAGHVAVDIVETARAKNSELIVMGSRGLPDLQSILVGSVTHKVLQIAYTPVLVVGAAEMDRASEVLLTAERPTVPVDAGTGPYYQRVPRPSINATATD